jgi:uncharacterized membrane protein YhiD involved in acid resistance
MNDLLQEITQIQKMAYIYEPYEILVNLLLAFLLGMLISFIYKKTHKGLSYSQSFMLTLVFVTIIVSAVLMTIGNNLARAFALVGALSIIRFRTVVKDTKDTAYVFLALSAGMAAGTSSYFLAIVTTVFVSIVAVILHLVNYGSFYKSEFILRFRAPAGEERKEYSDCLNKYAKTVNLLHIEPSGDDKTVKLTFDITMKKDTYPDQFSKELAKLDNVSEVLIVASKHDVDY